MYVLLIHSIIMYLLFSTKTLFTSTRNVPSGLGAPVFDKLEAELAKAAMSLPASKGFEIGYNDGCIRLVYVY